jgi:predicted metal-binding membrane protein
LLFAAGVMNLLWVALITAFIFVEKLLPGARYTSTIAGLALLAAGVYVTL